MKNLLSTLRPSALYPAKMATHSEVPVHSMGLNMKLNMRYRRNMYDVYEISFNYFVKLKHMSAILKICFRQKIWGDDTEHTLVFRYRTMR